MEVFVVGFVVCRLSVPSLWSRQARVISRVGVVWSQEDSYVVWDVLLLLLCLNILDWLLMALVILCVQFLFSVYVRDVCYDLWD